MLLRCCWWRYLQCPYRVECLLKTGQKIADWVWFSSLSKISPVPQSMRLCKPCSVVSVMLAERREEQANEHKGALVQFTRPPKRSNS